MFIDIFYFYLLVEFFMQISLSIDFIAIKLIIFYVLNFRKNKFMNTLLKLLIFIFFVKIAKLIIYNQLYNCFE